MTNTVLSIARVLFLVLFWSFLVLRIEQGLVLTRQMLYPGHLLLVCFPDRISG
jgi:hypothetical protein